MRKITCASVRRMRGSSVVFTTPVPCLQAKHLDSSKKKNVRSLHFDVCDHEEDCHHEDGCHPEEEELAAG